MIESIKGSIEETTLKIAKKLLGYRGSSRFIFNGIRTYSLRFSDGSLYVIETYEDLVRTRTTGSNAEVYELLLRVMNLTEL